MRDSTVSGDAILDGILDDDIGPLDAVDLPIVVISCNCIIAHVNRAATTVLGLKATDGGRSVGDCLPGIENLTRICARVIADGAPHRIETRDRDRSFLLRIAPCRGKNRSMLGAVLAFTNITAFRASIDQAIYEREYTKAILNAVIDPLVVLDGRLQVQTANRAFYALFGLSRDETQGIPIRKLGNKEWETSETWNALEETLSAHTEFRTTEIEGEFPAIGRRTIVLEARELKREGNALILVTFHDVTEQKEAERTTSLLAAIVDYSEDAIISERLDGTLTTWNKGAERLFGYMPEEAIGQHITLIVPWERRAEEEDILRRLTRGERVHHFETARRRKDGSNLDVSLTISPIRDGAGRVIGASNVVRDITDRKRVERSLSEQARLLDLSSDAIFVRDADDRVTYWNRAANELYGFTGEEALGRVSHELLHTQFPGPLDTINEQLTRDQHWTGELVHTRKDGAEVIVNSRWVLDRKGNSDAWCTLETNNDITQQKQTEKALRESEERFRALVTASSDVVYRMNADWSEMRHLDGRGFITDTGKPTKDWLNEYIHPDDQPLVLRTIRDAVRTKSTFELEHRVRRIDGTLGWTYSRAVPLFDAGGKIVEWFGAASDVTDRREAEERYRKRAETLDGEVRARTRELEEQSSQVRELSWRLLRSQNEERRHIARELHDSAGQTLTVLGINLAQLAQKAGRTAPELAGEAEQIQETVQQLHREIRTTSYLLHPPLLDESGLNAAISWYVKGLQERSGLEVRLDSSKEVGRLPHDMELVVFRIVQECLTNIHRHSGSKTALIRIARERNQVTLEIGDDGKGISRERLAEIQSGHSGMGITGMLERLRQFEGTLDIESGEGGTRVFATIPIPKGPDPGVQSKAEPLQAAGE